MEKKIITKNNVSVAVIHSDEIIIDDAQSALDLIATIAYYDRCSRIAINKEAFAEEFFVLRTGLAGDILQKFANYAAKLAIIGDFSAYKSDALKDFISESNRGNAIFFVPDEKQAVEKLTGVQPFLT